MNQNSLLALVTLIALLWINGGDCQKEAQNENEVDIAKRQKGSKIINMKPVDCFCDKLKKCESRCKPSCAGDPICRYKTDEVDSCFSKCGGIDYFDFPDCKRSCNVRTDWAAQPGMADEDEADEAKSDEVDIAKRQKGLKILKAWKRDEAEMAKEDEADEDKAQN